MAELKIDFDPSKALVEQQGGWSGDMGDWMVDFAKSAVMSVPELVGITPPEDTLRWRAEHPKAGFVSELSGMAVPYMGWLKVGRAIKPLENLAKAAELGAIEKPFTALAKAEAIRLLPFEAGRVAASQVIGDKAFTEMGMEAGLNLALGSALYGGVGMFGAMGKAAKPLREMIPGIDEISPPQLLLRKIDELLPTASPDDGIVLADQMARLDQIARAEIAPRYVDKAFAGKDDALNRLFKTGISGPIEKRRLTSGATDQLDTFNSEEGWQNIVKEAGLAPDRISRDAQFPRVITFSKDLDYQRAASRGNDMDNMFREMNSTFEARGLAEGWDASRWAAERMSFEGELKAIGLKADEPIIARRRATQVDDAITKRLSPVGDGWFTAQEPENGMFVMAKKFGGSPGKGSENDKWLLFKTDKPAVFANRSQQFANAQVALEKWRVGPSTVERSIGKPGELFTAVHGLTETYGAERYLQLGQATGGPRGIAKFIDKYTPEKLKGNAAVQHGHQLVREYFTPTARQFQKSTLANWVMNQAKIQQDLIDNWGQKVLQGEIKLDPKRPLTQLVVKSTTGTGRSIEAVISDLDKEGLIGDFMKIWRQGASSVKAANMAGIRPRAVELARELESADADFFRQLNRFEDAAGKTPTRRAQGHYLLSRSWEGDFFNALRDASGKVIGMASGATRKAASVEAKRLAASLTNELGRPVRVAEPFVRNVPAGIPRDLIPFVTNPGFTLQRQNIRGFKWDMKEPTARELMEAYSANISRRTRYMGTLGREALLSREVARLSVDDPFAYRGISNRFNQMSGIEGEFSRAQNRLVDKVLAPMLGSGSASKLVSITNSALMHLQLGALKLSYPITNLVGTIQTIAPELAFVMNGGIGDVSGRYYSLAPAMGSRGVSGVMGFLSPLKIMGQSLREMAKPDKALREAMERAVNDRTLDPRLIEDYIGKNRAQLKDWKGAITSTDGLWQWTKALSEFMPAASERFARVHSFTSGYVAARDIFKMEGDAAYRFAKQFTERTMYLYSASDRPLVFTSPLGSSMGLFKNWMMNYMGSMIEYGDQAFNKGVWSPLAWQTIGTFAVGGAAATPLYWAAEGASRLFADKHLMQWAYDEWSGREADAIMYGLPAALTGVSLSSQMTAPGANPMRDAAQLFSFAVWDRAKNLGGAAQAAVDNWRSTGTHPAADPDVRGQLIRAFAPVNLYRIMATQEEGTIRTLGTDLPQVKGLGPVDIMLYRMGLQPTTVERNLKVANELYEDRQKHTNMVKAMGDSFAEAMQKNDNAAMNNIYQRATVLGIDPGAIFRSASTRLRLADTPVTERLAKPMELQKWGNVLQPQ